MRTMNTVFIRLLACTMPFLLFSCKGDTVDFDASGTFEAEETLIAAEATGTIKMFTVEEGQILENNQYIGYIDSTELVLKKKVLEAQMNALVSKKPNVAAQLAALQSQLKTAQKEKNRIANLVKEEVLPQKQLDDANYQIDFINKQIEGLRSTLNVSTKGLDNDVVALGSQLDLLNEQLGKCKLINPVKGTVLIKYVNQNEMATVGKPLYMIADLSTIILRAYITESQLAKVKLNQKVQVLTDENEKSSEGTIIWINDKAEFTPKSVQTQDERANRVYAIKVKVENDGKYKIGMYGELKF